MPSNELIEIRLTGNDILPENVRAGDIADILNSVEDMIESVVVKQQPQITKEDVVIGLVNIMPGSVRLQFTSQVPEQVFPAFEEIADAVARKRFEYLPSTSLKSLQAIASFTRKRNCLAEFITHDGTEKVLAQIAPDSEITRVPPLTGETVLYGQIIRVGGRTPKAMLETVDGQTVYCDVSRDIAQKLGEKLYLSVGLYGVAQWDPQTLSLEEFRIQEVTTYQGKPVVEAMGELSMLTASYYSDVADVDKYVSDIRSGELEG